MSAALRLVGPRLDVFGLPVGAAAPRPWATRPIAYADDLVRLVDARGEEIGRLRAADAAFVVALVNGCAND